MEPIPPLETSRRERRRRERLRSRILSNFTVDDDEETGLVESLFTLEQMARLEPRVRHAAALTNAKMGPLGYDDPEWLVEFLGNVRGTGGAERS